MRIAPLFYFLAGSSEVVVEDCPEVERNYHAAIGGFVAITAVVASMSGGYALYTVFGSVPWAVVFGAFWGVTIGAIDRFIVMTIDRTSEGGRVRTAAAALSRLLLAGFVAIVVARPLELRIFAPEIGQHLAARVDAALTAEVAAVRADLAARERDHEGARRLLVEQQARAELGAQRDGCLAEQATLRDAVHAECDGTGGSRRVGVGPVCELKRDDYEEVANRCAELAGRIAAADALIAALLDDNDRAFAAMRQDAEARIGALEASAGARLAAIDAGDAGSLLTRLEALHALARSSAGMAWALGFVTALFVIIETLPVGLKLLVAGKGTYSARIVADEDEARKRHRIERRHRERQRMYHRQTVSTIARAVRDQQRSRVLDTIAVGEDVVTNDVNLELRRRTEVTSVDAAATRTVFPPESAEVVDDEEQTELGELAPDSEGERGGPRGLPHRGDASRPWSR